VLGFGVLIYVVGKVHVGMGFPEGGPLAQTLGKPTNIRISMHITYYI
jgi:hypothetical protein